ncbi:hypothetical protein CAPTEDRAFT_186426 [Capitella teleta]|uniref:L-asparaginase N-terminal domain-containing protein n=1 Tax=Capitella teleta TaxID=283909 RepID=R7U3G3_CAPTE|nr:hypothetical protein CAPTEDRAFT_186426 [Capitella teleta]|eukprot:ELU00499.1 hypothetical protein CAPTEDRAFT_186426 [Capitella teleta]
MPGSAGKSGEPPAGARLNPQQEHDLGMQRESWCVVEMGKNHAWARANRRHYGIHLKSEKSIEVKWKSIEVKWKSIEVKWKSTEVKWKSTEVERKSTEVKWKSTEVKRKSTEVKRKSTEVNWTSRPKRKLMSYDQQWNAIDGVNLALVHGPGRCSDERFGAYSPEPNFLVPELRELPIFHDPSYAVHFSDDEKEQPLVMPRQKDGKRIVYCVFEYEPLLDSSNMTYDDYARLATDIQDNYSRFDAFVVLHGTDTMAFTASALSFMLENLGKPVILTGSQIPIFEAHSDGRDNFSFISSS